MLWHEFCLSTLWHNFRRCFTCSFHTSSRRSWLICVVFFNFITGHFFIVATLLFLIIRRTASFPPLSLSCTTTTCCTRAIIVSVIVITLSLRCCIWSTHPSYSESDVFEPDSSSSSDSSLTSDESIESLSDIDSL
jgi:hypothetical protein